VAADIWLTPFLGVDAEYRFTLLNTLNDSAVNNNTISTSQSWIDLGFKFRRFFGMALSSTSMAVGLKYINYNLSVPASASTRAKEQVQGPQLSLDLSVSFFTKLLLEFWFGFRTLLQSLRNINPGVQSGASNQSMGLGANVGGEYRLSRQTRAFFKFSALAYRSQFSGVASGTDPITGVIPSGVTVTNAFYMFDLGLRFGH